MKNKNGNVGVIALIIIIVAVTASVITWFVATKMNAPAQKETVVQPEVSNQQNQSTTPIVAESKQAVTISDTQMPAVAPEQVVDKFFKWYISGKNTTGTSDGMKKINSNQDTYNIAVGGGQVDGVLCMQYYPKPEGVAVSPASISADMATVTVTINDKDLNGKSVKISAELKNIDNSWKITKIVCN